MDDALALSSHWATSRDKNVGGTSCVAMMDSNGFGKLLVSIRVDIAMDNLVLLMNLTVN